MRRRRPILNALAALGLLFVLVTVLPVDQAITRVLAGPWTDAKGDVMILLGSDAISDGTIGYFSYWRSVYAWWAWRGGGFREMVISGKSPVSDSMQNFLACQGVPRDVMRTEPRSTSTRENALFTAEMLRGEPGRKVLMTSDFHMFRASRAFRKAGLEVTPRPLPDAGKQATDWRLRWQVFLELVTELSKIVYYAARGWI